MSKRKNILAGALVVLVLTVGIVVARQLRRAQGTRQKVYSETLEVEYVWNRNLVQFEVRDDSKIADPTLNRLIRQETERLVPAMLKTLNWERAAGSFTVRIIGTTEPY